jgi:hypothetical protein
LLNIIYYTLFFVILSLLIFNLTPFNQAYGLNILSSLPYVIIGFFFFILYFYLEAVYIYTVTNKYIEKGRHFNLRYAFINFIHGFSHMISFLKYIIGYVVLSIIVAITMFYIHSLITPLSLTMFIIALILEYVILPRIIIYEITGRGIGWGKLLLLYTLPWIILRIGIGTLINYPIYLLCGRSCLYPYYWGWSASVRRALEKNIAATWLPTYGDWLTVIFIAIYSRWATENYV